MNLLGRKQEVVNSQDIDIPYTFDVGIEETKGDIRYLLKTFASNRKINSFVLNYIHADFRYMRSELIHDFPKYKDLITKELNLYFDTCVDNLMMGVSLSPRKTQPQTQTKSQNHFNSGRFSLALPKSFNVFDQSN